MLMFMFMFMLMFINMFLYQIKVNMHHKHDKGLKCSKYIQFILKQIIFLKICMLKYRKPKIWANFSIQSFKIKCFILNWNIFGGF
jgi:hypothetical protein